MFIGFDKSTILLLVSLFCVGCDQATKLVAKKHIEPGTVTKLMGDTIRLQMTTNRGAFLSIGSSLPQQWRFWIFTIFVSISLVVLLVYYHFSKSLSFLSALGLSLIISGGFSNLIDRALFGGIVVDFLNIGIGNLRTGIINFADIAITVGMILILYAALVKDQKNAF